MNFDKIKKQIESWETSGSEVYNLAIEYVWSKWLAERVEKLLEERIREEISMIKALTNDELRREKLKDLVLLIENLDLDPEVLNLEYLDRDWNPLPWTNINRFLERIENVLKADTIDWIAVNIVEQALSEWWENETRLSSWDKPFYLEETEFWLRIKFAKKWALNDEKVLELWRIIQSRWLKIVDMMNKLFLAWDSEENLNEFVLYMNSELRYVDKWVYADVLLEQAEKVEIHSASLFIDLLEIATRNWAYDKITNLLNNNKDRLDVDENEYLTIRGQKLLWIIPELIDSPIDENVVKSLLLLYKNRIEQYFQNMIHEFALVYVDDKEFMSNFESEDRLHEYNPNALYYDTIQLSWWYLEYNNNSFQRLLNLIFTNNTTELPNYVYNQTSRSSGVVIREDALSNQSTEIKLKWILDIINDNQEWFITYIDEVFLKALEMLKWEPEYQEKMIWLLSDNKPIQMWSNLYELLVNDVLEWNRELLLMLMSKLRMSVESISRVIVFSWDKVWEDVLLDLIDKVWSVEFHDERLDDFFKEPNISTNLKKAFYERFNMEVYISWVLSEEKLTEYEWSETFWTDLDLTNYYDKLETLFDEFHNDSQRWRLLDIFKDFLSSDPKIYDDFAENVLRDATDRVVRWTTYEEEWRLVPEYYIYNRDFLNKLSRIRPQWAKYDITTYERLWWKK